MKWLIPAKTFLLGEYAALNGEPAILLTTAPCFQLELSEQKGLLGIHPDSPAGQWWQRFNFQQGLIWQDPYHKGGLGASSAQFLGAYLASCHLLNKEFHREELLAAYYQCAWRKGLRPSGYDVLAQASKQCVYIHRQNKIIESISWPFTDLGFLLIHTGQKIATHDHLQTLELPDEKSIKQLAAIVAKGKAAFAAKNSAEIINAINAYQDCLTNLHLTTKNSNDQLALLRQDSAILAAKGCGALGGDVLLVVTKVESLPTLVKNVTAKRWTILANNNNLYTGDLLKNNHLKA